MGLDMYLYRVNKKINSQEELNLVVETANNKASVEEFIKYLDNKQTFEEFINNCFPDDFIKGINDKEPKAIKYLKNCILEYDRLAKVYQNPNYTGLKIENIGYWRKHANLHGRMEDMYYDRGGEAATFNCEPLLLYKEDIEELIDDVEYELENGEETAFNHTEGFFYGKSTVEDWKDTLDIFKKVLKETDWENETVYYDSWW